MSSNSEQMRAGAEQWTPREGDLVADTVTDLTHSDGVWRFVTEPREIWPTHTKLILPAVDSLAAAWEALKGLNAPDCGYRDLFPFTKWEAGVLYWQSHLEGPRYEPNLSNNGPIRLDNYEAHMRDMQKFGALMQYLAHVRSKEAGHGE